ncbi:MAG: rubredoxin-like domain-containing protein [Planctomycetota bacterium]
MIFDVRQGQAPQKCPVCGASKGQFKEVV